LKRTPTSDKSTEKEVAQVQRQSRQSIKKEATTIDEEQQPVRTEAPTKNGVGRRSVAKLQPPTKTPSGKILK
jgi:hypothetical protein